MRQTEKQTERRYDGGDYPPDPDYMFCGLFIPAPMWETRQLSLFEKCVLAEIIYYSHSAPPNQMYRIVDEISFDLNIDEGIVSDAIDVLVRNRLIGIEIDTNGIVHLKSTESHAMSMLSDSDYTTNRENVKDELAKLIKSVQERG